MLETPPRGRHGPAPYFTGPRTFTWVIAGPGGNAAPRFASAVRNLPPRRDDGSVQARIVGVHGRSHVLASRFAEAHQIAHASSTLSDLLQRPDVRAVYVANHPQRHAETVLQALQAGKHVLCEPPLALSLDETLSLMHTAQDRGLSLGLNYQHRVDPALAVARHRLAEHELGDLAGGYVSLLPLLSAVDVDRRLDPAWGGVLTDLTLRAVDALRYVSGDRVASAAGLAGPPLLADAGVADVHGILRMQRSGAIFHLHTSYQVAHGHSHLELMGASRSLTIDPWRPDHSSALSLHDIGGAHAENLPAVDLWQQSILAFQQAALAESDPPATAADDALNLCVAQALAEAVRTRTQCTVHHPFDLAHMA